MSSYSSVLSKVLRDVWKNEQNAINVLKEKQKNEEYNVLFW